MYLNAAQVEALIHPGKLIDCMRKALIAFSKRDGTVTQPIRTTVPVTKHQGYLGVMPALSYDGEGALGAKLVSFYPSATDSPTHSAVVILLDVATGVPLTVMDGTILTKMRTAAVSAVSTDVFASPDSAILAILGSGEQARSHAQYLSFVRNFREIRVWSRNETRVAEAVHDIQKMV